MIETTNALPDAWVDPRVWESQPDYLALVLVADGLSGRPSDAGSEGALLAAEAATVALLNGLSPEDLVEIGAWRSAFASFGVNHGSPAQAWRRCCDSAPAGCHA